MNPSLDHWRWLGVSGAAAAVTCGLFVLMYHLTAADDGIAGTEAGRVLSLDFVRIERDQTLIEKSRFLPPKPRISAPQQQPVAPPLPRPLPPRARMSPEIRTLPYMPKPGVDFGALEFAGVSEIAPLVRVSPIYPARAERRGIEGWVKVSFTIAEDGTVADAQVVDAEPAGVFDRAALSAISKWRYQPQVLDGQTIRRSGVTVTVEFQLQK